MDTDDLSEETYCAIIEEAERFNHCLTLWFGDLARSCKDEDEYIKQSIELINEIKKCDEDELKSIFFGDSPPGSMVRSALTKISGNIVKVKKIKGRKL
ncbi:MAG: hypothetical protein KKC50_08045 [Candidatus Omnitrophica bacterium]|nr:hypothetical protein [Candidatus Omnitrophota bacterium]